MPDISFDELGRVPAEDRGIRKKGRFAFFVMPFSFLIFRKEEKQRVDPIA